MSDQVRETPAPRTPVARLIGVLTSPGEAFKEIAAHPGWLPPFLVYMVVFCICFGVYAVKADWIAIVTEQIESSPFMKLVPDANRDEAIRGATAGLQKLSRGQMAATNLCNIGSSIVGFYHGMTLLYATLFVMVGSLKDLKLGKAWGRFLLCLLLLIGYIVVYSISNFAFRDSPASALLMIGTGSVVMVGLWTWLLNGQAARDGEFHKMLTVCCYSSVVLMVSMIAVMALSLAHQGDIQVAIDKLVPSNLGAVLAPDNAVLRTLFSSLDIFILWFLAVLSIGFKTVTKLSFGMSASMTFLPWGLVVMVKIAWAAVFG